MKTTLLRTNLRVLFLLFVLVASSCSKDKDDIKPDTTNQLEHDGKTYTLKAGLTEDFGKGSYYGNTDTHHNIDYTITDGEFTLKSGQVQASENASILVYVELFSPGISGFNTGTFTFIDNTDDDNLTESAFEAKYKNKAFFNNALLAVDSNNSKTLGPGDLIQIATGGTIKVSGSANAPTLEYNFTFADGKTLRGTYTGSFLYSDET